MNRMNCTPVHTVTAPKRGYHLLPSLVLLAWVFMAFFGHCRAGGDAALPRSTPEAEGISSARLIAFFKAAAGSRHEFHSVMMLRHGKVIAEGWWAPYRPDLRHTLYSTSKSFTATAVGFAVAEKKLAVDDAVVSFFPDSLPEKVSPHLSDLKVKHLLSMSVGHDSDPTRPVGTRHDDWVKAFLAVPVVHKPGTRFVYNSVATYMLSAIVQKVTGRKVVEYLKPRLFDPLGIEGMDWETGPRGINTGGWGLRLKTEDMAKFGQLFLQKGRWRGRRILPEAWVAEATTVKIMQDPDAPQARKDASDWLQGYCYQMWRSRHKSYRADGAFGQFILVLPEQDAVVAITAETSDMQSELNLVWEHLLPALQPNALQPAPDSLKRLRDLCSGLALPLPAKKTSPLEATISGQTFDCAANERGIETIRFSFEPGACRLVLTTSVGRYPLRFGSGRWRYGETRRKGPNLVSRMKSHMTGLPPFKTAGSYTWTRDNELLLTLRYIESPHTETFRCRFEEKHVFVDSTDRFSKADKNKTIKGTQRHASRKRS